MWADFCEAKGPLERAPAIDEAARGKDHPNVANDHAIRAKALENQVEHIYREAIADLFNGPEDIHHVMEMLKLREIYRHLSNCADRGDEAAK